MAPNSFETDQLASDADSAGQPEILMQEPEPATPKPARRSLFQIVCLQGKPKAKPQSSV